MTTGSLWTRPVKRWPNDVIVECPRCHRPLGVLEDHGPGEARFTADVVEAEDGFLSHGGSLGPEGKPRNYGGATARVAATDPAFDPLHTDPSGRGRKTIRCVSRYHRQPVSRRVTQAAVNDTYWRARAAGITRVSLFDLRVDAVQR
jgi:hypothetical protein